MQRVAKLQRWYKAKAAEVPASEVAAVGGGGTIGRRHTCHQYTDLCQFSNTFTNLPLYPASAELLCMLSDDHVIY